MTLDFLKRAFSVRSYIGVDIGTTSIKAIELSRSDTNPRLTNYGLLETVPVFERPNGVIQANSLRISEKEAGQLLKLLVTRSHFSATNAIASIPSFASFTTMIEIPDMSQAETEKAMPFQIKQSIPLPLSEIAVDWVRVGQRDDANGFVKQQILIIAIPNEIIARFKAVFRIAGLSLRALEVETLSCSRALVGTDQTPTIILDIGARSSNISVIEKGFLKNNSQIDYGGDSITDAIANGLSVSYKRAEELKRRIGMLGGSGEFELSTLETPFVDVILNEVQSARQKAVATLGVTPERVMIVGGGANLAGIETYAEQRLGIPVVPGNGLLYVDVPQELSVMVPELKTRFAVATGLAIKSLLS